MRVDRYHTCDEPRVKHFSKRIMAQRKGNLDLNDHHQALVLNFMRFARFQRAQCLKCIRTCFEDAKNTKFTETTYTVDEVLEVMDELSQETLVEIEAELINSAHMSVLLMQQIFQQAEHWHLDLDADLAELENRDLLDKVKSWEDSELSHQPSNEKPSLSPLGKKHLAPLNHSEGPMQLLRKQIEEANAENAELKKKLKKVEMQATEALDAKDREILELKEKQELCKKNDEDDDDVVQQSSKEIEELTSTVQNMKTQMLSAQEMDQKTQLELKENLKETKHSLLEVQHQLKMAEKELEKKFSQTGAYKNMKKMLASKNDQIKELRQKVKDLGGANDSD